MVVSVVITQVIDAMYADGADDFDAVDTGVEEVDDFGIPVEKKTDQQPDLELEIQGQTQAAQSNDLDDEIPF